MISSDDVIELRDKHCARGVQMTSPAGEEAGELTGGLEDYKVLIPWSKWVTNII